MLHGVQAVCTFLLLFHQVKGDKVGTGHDLHKRHISVLAREGHLPGKRYLSPPLLTNRNGLRERLEADDEYTKRFVDFSKAGSLHRAIEEKRLDDIENLMRELLTEEDLRRLELLRNPDLSDEINNDFDEAKRSISSLAKGGAFPGKRNVGALARAGYLKNSPVLRDFPDDFSDEDGDSYDKRGGISSLARNGLLSKRYEDDLEELMNEVYGIDNKRNVASLARNYNFPSKKNIGSFLKNGGRPGMSKKMYNFDWGDYIQERTRTPSLLKQGMAPFDKEKDYEDWEDSAEGYPLELAKRYVATLLRQGRLPIGSDADSHEHDSNLKNDEESYEKTANEDNSGYSEGVSMRQKKSAPPQPKGMELKTNEHTVAKREIFGNDYSPLDKRFYAVRGGGKIPGGRLPQIGRSRSRHMNSGRRRH